MENLLDISLCVPINLKKRPFKPERRPAYRKGTPCFQGAHPAAPWFVRLTAPLIGVAQSGLHPTHLTPHTALEHQPLGFMQGSSQPCLFSPRATPTPTSEGRGSITHGTSNVGRVVDTRRPFVSAVAVCGDESVLLSISGAAIDLVFPAWLRRTLYP